MGLTSVSWRMSNPLVSAGSPDVGCGNVLDRT